MACPIQVLAFSCGTLNVRETMYIVVAESTHTPTFKSFRRHAMHALWNGPASPPKRWHLKIAWHGVWTAGAALFFFFIFFCAVKTCQPMWELGGGGHMLASAWAHKLPLSADCIWICICIWSFVSVMARALQNMLLIELNWTWAQFDELRFSVWFMRVRAGQMKC